MAFREWMGMVEKTIAEFTGASYLIDKSGRHPRVLLEHHGQKRFIVIPLTASDHRAMLNARGDIRRTLRGMAQQGANNNESYSVSSASAQRSGFGGQQRRAAG